MDDFEKQGFLKNWKIRCERSQDTECEGAPIDTTLGRHCQFGARSLAMCGSIISV